MPYSSMYIVESRLGKPSKSNPGMKSRSCTASKRPPLPGISTTYSSKTCYTRETEIICKNIALNFCLNMLIHSLRWDMLHPSSLLNLERKHKTWNSWIQAISNYKSLEILYIRDSKYVWNIYDHYVVCASWKMSLNISHIYHLYITTLFKTDSSQKE